MASKKTKKPTAVGAHIYAGGFAIGVMEHFDVLAHLEEWNFGVQTVRDNLAITVHVGTPDQWPCDSFNRVDFVYANPPCAAWSALSGGNTMSWVDDPRPQHWVNCLGLLDRLEPTVFACESVRGIYKNGRSFLHPFILAARKKGYRATHVLCNGRDHGVPQNRPRYFLVLSRVDVAWQPTGLKKDVTIADVWRKGFKTNTVSDKKAYADRYISRCVPGHDLRRTFNALHKNPQKRTQVVAVQQGRTMEVVRGRPPFAVKRLRGMDALAHVVTGSRHLIHPVEHRYLSVEEQAALCCYPRGYEFKGTINQKYAQIAKAVMPPVAEYLARMVAAAIRAGKKNKVLDEEEITVLRTCVEHRPADPYRGELLEWKPPAAPAKKVRAVRATPAAGAAGTAVRGSGYRMREMIVKKMSNADILKVIRREFPDSKAKDSDVYWNKRKLAQQGGVP